MTDNTAGPLSRSLFARAQTLMPGGVNSPVRAFRAVGGTPFFVASAQGAHLTDVDGNRYIDFVQSWGPMILGHAPACVREAICRATETGTSFGAPHEGEIALAEEVSRCMPHIEMLRLVSSGTEATMSAIRLARGITGKTHIVKFEGCYHGHADAFLIRAGSGAATLSIPDSPGVTPGTAAGTCHADYNDLDSVARCFAETDGDVAAVIVEPVAGNMGCVPPVPGFLEGLRALCTEHGALLIFDEVITGFRIAKGGAAERYGVTPDLTTIGKILGGGLPVGAYGGSRDLMRHMAPSGAVYQAGTLSGNPLATAAGLATLRAIGDDDTFYDRLETTGAALEAIVTETAQAHGIPVALNRVGSMLGLFLRPGPVRTWQDVRQSDAAGFSVLFRALLQAGVYIAPSPFETIFVGSAHDAPILDATRAAFDQAFAALARTRKDP
ncbi:MAG: glutamate-1-semialdehyde 2,1-aminomutase [Proteobacteria bacterium]|nr:glutamate-1-semialdehyde 2,1-aminomutase [Pseudomonadota bacterium]